MKMIDASVADLCTEVVIVPSMYDCQEHITYPVLPLDFKNLSSKMHMVINGLDLWVFFANIYRILLRFIGI